MDSHFVGEDSSSLSAGCVGGVGSENCRFIRGLEPSVGVFAAAGVRSHGQRSGSSLAETVSLVGRVLRQGQLAINRHRDLEGVTHTGCTSSGHHAVNCILHRTGGIVQRAAHI